MRQQQKGAPWSRQKSAAHRKIKGKQGQQNFENRGPGLSGIYQSEDSHGQSEDQFRISFLLRPVYDTLPSPVNLHQCGLVEDPTCKLCSKRGTMAHILPGCQVALTQGRYRWRHDKVLRELADVLEAERRRKRPTDQKPGQIQFMRQG